MNTAQRPLLLFFAFILFLCAILPTPRIYAEAHITRFYINDLKNGGVTTEVIAGDEYLLSFDSDAASTVSMDNLLYDYSTNNGATWINLPNFNGRIIMPIDPQLTSAIYRVSAYLHPSIGANSYSEKTIGPFKILQPGSPSDVAATANKDNSVTLTWNDNSNMESYYQIVRDGPDGSKTFTLKNTKDNIGPLSYTDQATNPNDSIIYAYSLYTVIDQYNLLDGIKPRPVSVLVKTKLLTPKVTELIKGNSDLFKKKITDPPKGLITDNKSTFSEKYADKLSQYILDVDKVPVEKVKVNNTWLTLEEEESQTLTATITPANATNQKLTWSSVNHDVAVVDSDGKVTGISAGFTIIWAKSEKGLAGNCNVKVTKKPKFNKPASNVLNPEATHVPTPAAPKKEFTDIAGHWANEEIKQAVELGFVNGYADGTFQPDGNVTRAEFAYMIVNGIKATTEGSGLTFMDKDKIGAWAIQAVSIAVKLGIISGYSDGTFRPNANITHAEMIAMVVRASGLPMDNTQPTEYADDADIPNWAKPAVKTAELNGIIIVSGISGKTFAPQALSTRAEAASAIVRILKIGK